MTNTMSVETPVTEPKQQEEQSVLRLRGGGLCVDCLAYEDVPRRKLIVG
jgi:hypothetical protein